MGKTVRQLLNEVDSHELTEWMAFERIEPWDGSRGDLQAGIIASTIANVNRGKGAKAHKASDFMPKFGTPIKQSPDQLKALLQGLVKATKGRTKEVPPKAPTRPENKPKGKKVQVKR